MTGQEKEYYTLQELADLLRVTRQCIYNNVRNGNIPAVKFGREYRITADQLQDILQNGYGRKRQD